MMKKVVVFLLFVSFVGCAGEKKAEVKDQKSQVSYSIGLNIGANIVRDSLDLDYAALLQGIKDAWLDTTKHLMKPAEVQKCMMQWQQDMQVKQSAKMQARGMKNKEEGDKFLAENKKDAGVVTTASGLQYKVITQGKGPKPTKDQTVSVHYVGTLLNGQEFDSSIKRGQPLEFPVGGVIPGWTEALQLMNVGSKWKIFIPSELAYGDRGAGDMIPPGATLIFEVELLAIK
jgi:FKBP-type peptidyl-prolyl cis-trans isomerase